MIKRIVVPVDFSPQSRAALEYAVELAKSLRAAVDVCFVVETIYFAAPGSAQAVEAMVEAQQQHARAELAKLERRYAPRGVRLRTAVLTGAPAPAICAAAARVGADLIVTASHGRGGVSRLLLGSVAERLARTAPCSVLTVRAKVPRRRRKVTRATRRTT